MNAYETSATVEGEGQVSVSGVPFAPGTEVEVTISPRRKSAEEFAATWKRVCAEMRSAVAVQRITDDEIRNEVDEFRAGR